MPNLTKDDPIPDAELDAEIATRLFGITRLYYPQASDPDDHRFPYYIPSGRPWRTHSIDGLPLPRFSQDVAAAWQVVEALRTRGYDIDVTAHAGLTYGCRIAPRGQCNTPAVVFCDGETAALAIARAAMHVVGASLP